MDSGSGAQAPTGVAGVRTARVAVSAVTKEARGLWEHRTRPPAQGDQTALPGASLRHVNRDLKDRKLETCVHTKTCTQMLIAALLTTSS